MSHAHELSGLPTPVFSAEPHGEHVVAQQPGEAKPEPMHFVEETRMTADKVPSNAPMWYQLVINGSAVSIICAVFLFNQFNQPSATQLIDRTLAGQEKLLDRQERSNDAFKDIVRSRGAQVDRVVASYEKAMHDAATYHDSAKKERESIKDEQVKTQKTLEKLVEVNTRAAIALDKIAEKK